MYKDAQGCSLVGAKGNTKILKMKRKNKKAIEKLELKVQLRLKKANTFPNSTLVLSKQNKTPTAFYLDIRQFFGNFQLLFRPQNLQHHFN